MILTDAMLARIGVDDPARVELLRDYERGGGNALRALRSAGCTGLEMLRQYLETALWSSTYLANPDDETDADREGRPLDDFYSPEDLTFAFVVESYAECLDFLALCDAAGLDLSDHADGQIGHDFWLTRNHHGAGFWDGDYDDGDTLTKIAHSFGSLDLIPGDGRLPMLDADGEVIR